MSRPAYVTRCPRCGEKIVIPDECRIKWVDGKKVKVPFDPDWWVQTHCGVRKES